MSRKCPSCGFDSADDAAWCDFCKEPFVKKAKAAAPPPADSAAPPVSAAPPISAAPAAGAAASPSGSPAVPPALAGLTKDQVDKLAVDSFLKADLEPSVGAPTWLRPLAWVAFALCVILGTAALFALQRRYQQSRPPAPPVGGPALTSPAVPASPDEPPQAPTRVL